MVSVASVGVAPVSAYWGSGVVLDAPVYVVADSASGSGVPGYCRLFLPDRKGAASRCRLLGLWVDRTFSVGVININGSGVHSSV